MAPEDRQVRKEEEVAELELRAAVDAMRMTEARQAAAKARLDNLLRSTRDILSRRRAASIAGLTPGRIQQIIDSGHAERPAQREMKTLESLGRAELGSGLREIRMEQGKTLEEVGAEAEIHPTTLSAIELGRKSPSARVLSRYIEALGGKLVADFDREEARIPLPRQ